MCYITDKAFSIVEEVLGYHADGLYVNEEVAYGDICPEDADILTNLDEGASIDYTQELLSFGLTKMVIVPKDFNYVIKIPFTGTYSFCYEDDSYNLLSTVTENVCEEEISFYEQLEDDPIQEFILPNIYIGNYNGSIPIYIQKKVEYIGSYNINKNFKNNTINAKLIDKIKKEVNYNFPTGFIYNIAIKKGISKTINILDKLKTNISDLHDQNYGCTKDGKSVIFDTGGYSSERWNLGLF